MATEKHLHQWRSEPQAPVTETKLERSTTDLTNETSTLDDAETEKKCTCGSRPKLSRNDTADSDFITSDIDTEPVRSRRIRRPIPIRRRYSISPRRDVTDPPALTSSTSLLEKLNTYDGVLDLPYPARQSIYLTTFPFTSTTVKKYAWLFAAGVEETFLTRPGDTNPDDSDDEFTRGRVIGGIVRSRYRNRSPYYNVNDNDFPSVYLSRALDTSVIPEDSNTAVNYLIVVENKSRPQGSKLLVAESRKAAGILMFYEALTGGSTVFVGAIVKGVGRIRASKVKRVESLEEAVGLKDGGEGVVGIVC